MKLAIKKTPKNVVLPTQTQHQQTLSNATLPNHPSDLFVNTAANMALNNNNAISAHCDVSVLIDELKKDAKDDKSKVYLVRVASLIKFEAHILKEVLEKLRAKIKQMNNNSEESQKIKNYTLLYDEIEKLIKKWKAVLVKLMTYCMK